MKKTILLFSFLCVMSISSYSATYTVTATGFMFSPNNLFINLGDTVIFNTTASHPVVEVDSATFVALGNTPKPGGFSYPAGSGTFVPTAEGNYYYVCDVHHSGGMVGFINVTSSGTGIAPVAGSIAPSVALFPNPASESVKVAYQLTSVTSVRIALYDVLGKEVALFLNENQPAGNYCQLFPLRKELKPGLYFVKTAIGNRQSVSKLIIR